MMFWFLEPESVNLSSPAPAAAESLLSRGSEPEPGRPPPARNSQSSASHSPPSVIFDPSQRFLHHVRQQSHRDRTAENSQHHGSVSFFCFHFTSVFFNGPSHAGSVLHDQQSDQRAHQHDRRNHLCLLTLVETSLPSSGRQAGHFRHPFTTVVISVTAVRPNVIQVSIFLPFLSFGGRGSSFPNRVLFPGPD